MANIQVNRITNANIYLDGVGLLGKAEEVSAPVIKAKMSEHKALGMVGAVEFPSGIEKLESKIKWNSFYADTLKKIGNPTQVLSWQIRGSLESYNSGGKTGEVPVVIFMKASCKDLPMGNFKQHDNVELESNLSVYYAKLEINGEPISEIDVLANIHKVGGQDILGAYRQNIGG